MGLTKVTYSMIEGAPVNVLDFGAVGDGITNDGPALNAALAYVRSKLIDENVSITLDLANGTYATNISINATGLFTGCWSIINGTIIGKCAGKAVLDTTGSRGGRLENLVISGDSVSTPSIGIQAARAAIGGLYGFCDNMLWDNVTTLGNFSLAGVYTYGQETTTYLHCRFWNSNKDAFSAIHTGVDTFPISSDYMTPISGETSFINNKYVNCDYRYLPMSNNAVVTGISKANPAVVSVVSNPFSNGDTVVISYVNGMSEINNVTATVANATPTSFELSGVDSTGYTTYTGGGNVYLAQSYPTVYFSRGEQQHFDTCYIVNYGTHNIRFDFNSTYHIPKSIWFDVLFEGAGSISHLEFTGVSTNRYIHDFKFETYNVTCKDYVIGHTGGGSTVVHFYTAKITAQNRVWSSPTLLDLLTKFAMYDADVSVENVGFFNPTNMGSAFRGSIAYLSGDATLFNQQFVSYLDAPYTPVVLSSIGTITSYTSSANQKRLGNMIFFSISISITDNGTGSGAIFVDLPANALYDAFICGRNITTGAMIQGNVLAGSNNLVLFTYNNAYPVSTGNTIKVSGCYVSA